MKKVLLLFILGTMSLGYFAQTYEPFPTSNASWIDIVFCDEHHYELVGDTVVNGVVYRGVYLNIKAYTQGATGCSNTNSFSIYGYYAGAFRNDSVNKRIYFLPPNHNRDTLLYDFNLFVGDTLPISYKRIHNQSNVPLVVSRVDSIFLGGIFRRRLTFNNCSIFNTDSLRLIEGIGSNQGLLGDYNICDPWQTGILYCFTNNGQNVYTNTVGTCQLITGLNTNKISESELEVRISPNPTKGIINIESELNIETLEVHSLAGNLLFTLTPLSIATAVELPNAPGVYFIKVHLKGGELVVRKVLKQ